MNINAIENSADPNAARENAPSQDAIRRAAQQFEAVLLMQLTSALNGAGGDDEDSLFGSDGGSGLAKQMFSEQLATTMAESGGIGLSDLILRQFGGASPKTPAVADKFANVISAVKDIKGNGESKISAAGKSAPFINRGGKIEPVNDVFTGNPDDFEVVSTFEDEARKYGVEETLRPLELNGRIVNTTRARIVPDSVLRNNEQNYVYVQPAPPEKVEQTDYQMPVSGRISSGFGNRFHPIDKKIKFHAGMDIAAPTGTPINAAAAGVVKFAGWNKGYGNLIVIEHPDGRENALRDTRARFTLKKANQVTANQPIAAVGSTGKSTGPHLHFEVREDGQPVNPRDYLSNVLSENADK